MKLLNKIILIYCIITILSQIYSLDTNRLNYLKENLKNKNKAFILHLIFPIVKKKLSNNKGFYTLLLNFIVFERYLIPEIRGRGLGRELANNLIKKCHIFILNDRTINSYKEYLQNSNYKFINIFKYILIKIG